MSAASGRWAAAVWVNELAAAAHPFIPPASAAAHDHRLRLGGCLILTAAGTAAVRCADKCDRPRSMIMSEPPKAELREHAATRCDNSSAAIGPAGRGGHEMIAATIATIRPVRGWKKRAADGDHDVNSNEKLQRSRVKMRELETERGAAAGPLRLKRKRRRRDA